MPRTPAMSRRAPGLFLSGIVGALGAVLILSTGAGPVSATDLPSPAPSVAPTPADDAQPPVVEESPVVGESPMDPSPTEGATSSPAPTDEPVPATQPPALPTADGEDTVAARRSGGFRLASFNILGSQHTKGRDGWASGVARARMAKDWLRREGTSVLGMTESQRDQIRVLTKGRAWTSYPRLRNARDTQTAQSVLWKPARWKFVRAKKFVIPFAGGQRREQPMVLLRHRASGRAAWVVSVHLQAGSSKSSQRQRRIGMKRMIANVENLQSTNAPVLLTGDMNSRRAVFCRVVGRTALDSPMGGSAGARRCKPPSGLRLDWIFGSRSVQWSGFRYADGGRINKITDHTVPVATVRW